MESKKYNLSETQLKELNKLWFIYGNDGQKHSHHNHRYIQNFIEHNEDSEKTYKDADKMNNYGTTIALTDECVNSVKEILNNK